jgi:hypothetical protein
VTLLEEASRLSVEWRENLPPATCSSKVMTLQTIVLLVLVLQLLLNVIMSSYIISFCIDNK